MINLYQAPMSTCVQKVRFTLEQKGLPWNGITVDLNNGENYSPEYMKINPKAVIPVLDDAGDVIFESNNICLYLNEKYPQVPLMPSDPKSRAQVRAWIQLIDEQVHSDSSSLTYAMAFGDRIRAKYDTPAKLEEYLSGMPDAGRRNSKRQMLTEGVESREFEIAVQRLSAMLQRLDDQLKKSPFLVGDKLTLADIVYSPYLTRLDHLDQSSMWVNKPAVADWFDRIRATEGYQKGLVAFFNPEAIARMKAGGNRYAAKVQSILKA